MQRPSPTSWPSRLATNGSSSGACPIRIDEKRGPDDEGGTFGPGPQLKRQWPHLPPQPADSTIELANRFQPKEKAPRQRARSFLTRASLRSVCSSAAPSRNGTLRDKAAVHRATRETPPGWPCPPTFPPAHSIVHQHLCPEAR